MDCYSTNWQNVCWPYNDISQRDDHQIEHCCYCRDVYFYYWKTNRYKVFMNFVEKSRPSPTLSSTSLTSSTSSTSSTPPSSINFWCFAIQCRPPSKSKNMIQYSSTIKNFRVHPFLEVFSNLVTKATFLPFGRLFLLIRGRLKTGILWKKNIWNLKTYDESFLVTLPSHRLMGTGNKSQIEASTKMDSQAL